MKRVLIADDAMFMRNMIKQILAHGDFEVVAEANNGAEAVILGCTESFATGYISSDYEDVFAFALLVLILIFKPAGILGRSSSQKI